MLLRHTELRNKKVTCACLIVRTVVSEGSLKKWDTKIGLVAISTVGGTP